MEQTTELVVVEQADVQIIEIDGELFADSRHVAKRLGVEHESVKKLIKDYPDDFEVCRFQIEQPPKGSLGGRPEQYALIPEAECLLLLTYVRNTDKSTKIKRQFVKAFQAMRAKLAHIARGPQLPQSKREWIELALEQEKQIEAQQAQLEAQKPAVKGYTALMATSHDLSITDACKHVALHPKKEVFPFLRDNGYLTAKDLPTQKAIDADILSLKQVESVYGATFEQAVVKVNQLDNFRIKVADKIRTNQGTVSLLY
jgi:phage regulator Rha-like protein